MRGEVDWGDYFDHLMPWINQRNDSNFLFLTYESMKSNSRDAIISIAKFLGSIYAEKVDNDQILDNILKHTSFASMSQNQSRWSSQRLPEMTPFIRKGEVGDWKSHFSDTQAQRLTQKFRERTRNTKIATLWDI